MNDESPFKLLKFKAEKAAELAAARPPLAAPKFGVYPLGSEDVVLSVAAFLTIIGVLEADDVPPADRKALAVQLRNGYLAPWAGS